MVISRIVRRLRPVERRAVVVEHQPTGRFLGVGLVLVARDAAIEFPDADGAMRFLDRHASEPSFRVLPATAAASKAA